MELTDDARQLLAGMIEFAPDVANLSEIHRHNVVDSFAVRFRWGRERTFNAYNALSNAGAILMRASLDYVTPLGLAEGMESIKVLHLREMKVAKDKERQQRRENWVSNIVGGVMAGVVALLIAYLVHLFGWNK